MKREARESKPKAVSKTSDRQPRRILAVDIGGTQIKMLVSDAAEPRKAPSGKRFTPGHMVAAVKKLARDWKFDAVSIGYPGQAGPSGPTCEPGNLGKGWVGFDFAAAFGCPVKVVNDAAMQALGSYEGGRMLFLGLGTGLGSALIADRAIVPLELGELPWNKNRQTLGEVLSARGLERVGGRTWRKALTDAVSQLVKAFLVDHVVIGGGNAKRLDPDHLPHGVRLGHNRTAFRGGFRLWSVDDVQPLTPAVEPQPLPPIEWRML